MFIRIGTVIVSCAAITRAEWSPGGDTYYVFLTERDPSGNGTVLRLRGDEAEAVEAWLDGRALDVVADMHQRRAQEERMERLERRHETRGDLLYQEDGS